MFDQDELGLLLKAVRYYQVHGCGFHSQDHTLSRTVIDKLNGDYYEEIKQRIRTQSKEVASYIETNEQFEEWFYELEGFSFRAERIYDDCERGDSEQIKGWLKTAYDMGFKAGRSVRD